MLCIRSFLSRVIQMLWTALSFVCIDVPQRIRARIIQHYIIHKLRRNKPENLQEVIRRSTDLDRLKPTKIGDVEHGHIFSEPKMLTNLFGLHTVLEAVLKNESERRLAETEREIGDSISKDIKKLRELCNQHCDREMSPKETVESLEKLCRLSSLNGQADPLCKKFNKWKTNSDLFLTLFQKLPKISELPGNGWLSNQDIDQFLQLFRHCFKRFSYFSTTTSDFMFCDFKKDRVTPEYTNLFYRYGQIVDVYDTSIIGKRGFRALSTLDNKKLAALLKQPVDCFAVVVNTDNCAQSGQHWVCFFVDVSAKRIDFFNSTGPGYPVNLAPLKAFLKYLQKELDVCGFRVEVFENEPRVQQKDGTCGVYCLLFILCRIVGASPQEIIDTLASSENRDDQLVHAFKRIIFANI